MDACPTCGTENAESAKFCQECGSALIGGDEARRRLVTALFCDLVGSTELGERLDAEPLRKLLDRYYRAMRAALERHGGTVEKFIGDAVVGSFGVPTAHEDDAVRAVRAALDMREAADELDVPTGGPSMDLQVRIGINSGEALADEASARHGTIAGDVYNTAARLQAVADPGSVVVSEATSRLLRQQVELEPLGAIELKGKSRPVEVFRVLSLRAAPSRFETPLVGRDRALASLIGALEDAIEARSCGLVTVLAPPGVGKSRLAAAFAEQIRDRATVLVGQTPAYGDGVTFAPLVELLVGASRDPTGDAEEVASGLRRLLDGQPDQDSVGERLANILGVGEARATDAAWAVRRLLEVMAAERPVAVVLEDVHWAEPPMLDLLDSVVERLHGPALVLCLARPELLEQRPTWAAGKPRSLTSTLPPLPADDARRLAELLLGRDAPPAVIERVCDTAEGNPLYLEQLTAMLEDQGLLSDGAWVGPRDVDIAIPTTLQALMAARLDRLEPATREVLELASVEGRRFRLRVLPALVDDLDRATAESAVTTLDRKGLVQPDDEATGRWRFAHALIRDAAYRGLSKERRADLHERLAEWILEADADQPDVDESAARHFERALRLREELGERGPDVDELALRAGELFADAGERAFAELDFLTSRDLLGRAEALLPKDSPRRLDLLPSLGVALTETGRPSETEALLAPAVEQARSIGAEREALRAKIQLLSSVVYRSPTDSEIEAAIEEALAAARSFEASGDDVGLAEAAIAIDYLEFVRGRVADALDWDFVALRDALRAGRPREAMQAAAGIVSYSAFGAVPFDISATRGAQLLDGGDPISEVTGHALLALAPLARGDLDAFQVHERTRRTLVERSGLTWLGATQELTIGSVELVAGSAAAAERRLREAREVVTSLGDVWWIQMLDLMLCTAAYRQGQRRGFLRLAADLTPSPAVPDRAALIQYRSIRARVAMLRDSPADAEVEARRAVELAESTDLLIDHADALTALAEALDARGFEDEAAAARGKALAMLRAKGHLVAVERLGG